MKLRSLAPVLLLCPLLVTSWAAGSSYAAEETCSEQAATIVGHAGQSVTGTDGDDVIVTGGASYVDAGAGDDLVCATGTAPPRLTVRLGDGEDIFYGMIGSAASETVTTDGDGAEDEHDVVQTGGGDDRVEAGVFDRPVLDDIGTGPGTDSVHLLGRSLGAGGDLRGGTGVDTLTLGYVPTEGDDYEDSLSDADWVFRNSETAGTATADGVQVLKWSRSSPSGSAAPRGPSASTAARATSASRATSPRP